MPWVIDGEIRVMDGVYLSLSFDDRILDGADAARFTNEVINYIEHPETITSWDRHSCRRTSARARSHSPRG